MTTTDKEAPQNFAVVYVPTLSERFWRALGFRYHLGDEPDGADGLLGWSCTVSNMHFSWADRLRLLLTGRLRIQTISYFDTPSPNVVKNRLDWEIKPPSRPESSP